MSHSSNLARAREKGGALLPVLGIILLLAVLVATAQVVTANNTRMTGRSRDVATMSSTAEGVIDYAYGLWKAEMSALGTPLTKKQAAALVATNNLPTLPAGMEYVSVTLEPMDDYGAAADQSSRISGLSEKPKGWPAYSYYFRAKVSLRQPSVSGNLTVNLERTFHQDLIPPVGGLFFLEGDFELYKPAPMIIGGNVHTNKNGYVSTHLTGASRLRFLSSSNISHVGSYEHAVAPYASAWSAPGANDTSPPVYDAGYGNQVSQTDKLEALGAGTTAEFNTTDGNPNNDSNRELIEPPVAGYPDPANIANSRIFNNAGLIIELTGAVDSNVSASPAAGKDTFTGSNIVIKGQNGTSVNKTQANAIIAAVANSQTVTMPEYKYVYNSSTKIWEWAWVNVTSLVEKTVYDKREKKNVAVTDINLGSLNSTLNALKGFNDILYIHNPNANSANPKAIRVNNAGVLPDNGLTIASQNGLYVSGDFNTGTTTNPNAVPANNTGNPNSTDASSVTGYTPKPAALVADAVMFLSNSWSDANATKSVGNRDATNTTVNAAIIGGYVPSGWTNQSGTQYGYSGGVNNFPRFLESWSGDSMTFSGAMVGLFKSEMFTGEWDTGDIYVPPARRWNFDTMLLERVIPGIPSASSFSRGRVRKS